MSHSSPPDKWYPAVSTVLLEARARMLKQVRVFMEAKNILEVETPVLSHAGVTDIHIENLKTQLNLPDKTESAVMYLGTSPEYAMKRLLAAGCGPIYQISRVFRDNESGRLHNPEFTMLEWYRPGYNQHTLMAEVVEFLCHLGFSSASQISYVDIFRETTGLDPHLSTLEQLASCARSLGLEGKGDDISFFLDLVFSHAIMPNLGIKQPVIIYDYPACQASLARLSTTIPQVACRFELFIGGMEIANGFHELSDESVQRKRFMDDNRRRSQCDKTPMVIDEYLLDALHSGLPDCAGIAIGLDRLLMAITGARHINGVIAFPVDRA